MIYLKFTGRPAGEPQIEDFYATESYFVEKTKGGSLWVHVSGSIVPVGKTDWHRCYVMNINGKTIDTISAPDL